MNEQSGMGLNVNTEGHIYGWVLALELNKLQDILIVHNNWIPIQRLRPRVKTVRDIGGHGP